jgi:SAM-dependent methyltransferase
MKKSIGNIKVIKEWAEVNQIFELNYQKSYNYRDFDDFEKQWKDIFIKFGLHKDYFNNKVLLDIGCGSRPALSYFSSNNEKHCMEPLLDELMKITKNKHTVFPGVTPWHKKENLPNTNISKWFTEEDYTLHSVPYETLVPELIDKVDFILCWNVLDHGYDWRTGLSNILLYLKKGGLLLLGTDFEAHKYHIGIDNPDDLKELIRYNFEVTTILNVKKQIWDRDYMVLARK